MKYALGLTVAACTAIPAHAEGIILACEGMYQAPEDVEAPKPGISVSINETTIVIGSAAPFDGVYGITRIDGDVLYFRPSTESGEPSREVQGSINRVSGELSLIHWSKDRWYHMVKGKCRTAQRLF